MRHSLLHTAGNLVWVARNERAGLASLLATYARLKLGELVAPRTPPDGLRRTRILGMDVAFFDHYWLVEMYEEIFLRRQYAFESSRERPLIVDVGSNIGLAILFFKRLFPGATVIGFEPDPEAFRLLERNVGENRLQNVRLLNEAVYDGVGWVELYGRPGMAGAPQTRHGGGARRGDGRRGPRDPPLRPPDRARRLPQARRRGSRDGRDRRARAQREARPRRPDGDRVPPPRRGRGGSARPAADGAGAERLRLPARSTDGPRCRGRSR